MVKQITRLRSNLNLWTHLQAAARRATRQPSAPGDPPGRLRDHPDSPDAAIRLVAYNAQDYQFHTVQDLDEVRAFRDGNHLVWIDIEGVGDASLLREIGELFGLSKLALEDVQELTHRPKFELMDHGVQLLLTMPCWMDGLEFEQVSIFVGADFVITFQGQNAPFDRFAPIRARLESGRPLLRAHGADYLGYALIDQVIDAGFPVLDEFAERYRQLEIEVIGPASRELLVHIHNMNSQLLTLYRAVWPHIDLLATLQRHIENPRSAPRDLFSPDLSPYLKDCADHALQIAELAKYYHEMGNQLLAFSVSLAGHRQNEITKVLTIIATIFIPLTFIAGVYGMNFNPETSPWNMPELNWPYAYPATMAFMLAIALGLVYYFWRKGWIGSGE